VTAVQARIAALEQTLTPVAERLPAYALLRTIPGIGPTVAAILLAEIGDIAWYTQFAQLRKLAGLDIVRVQSGQFAGQQRISKCGRALLRWALYQAAVGLVRTAAGRARLAAAKAKRRGDRFGGFKAMVALAAKQLRLVGGWGGAAGRTSRGGRAAGRTSGADRAGRAAADFPGELAARVLERGGSLETARGHRRAAPALSSPDTAGWVLRGSAATGWHHYDGA
jgi:hypothetical protein